MTGITCLVVGKISGDSHEFVKKLNQIVKRMPWIIKDLLKIHPIDLVVDSTIDGIRAGSKKLAKSMTKSAKFRVNLNRRLALLREDEIVTLRHP
ncbi:MAG: hypothetical protein ACXACF_03145 [Candidatus Hermodarchaeia archaeon]